DPPPAAPGAPTRPAAVGGRAAPEAQAEGPDDFNTMLPSGEARPAARDVERTANLAGAEEPSNPTDGTAAVTCSPERAPAPEDPQRAPRGAWRPRPVTQPAVELGGPAPARRAGRRRLPLALAGVVLAAGLAGGAWFILRPPPAEKAPAGGGP